MGAGVVKPVPGGNDSVADNPTTSSLMSCQNCSTEFTVFKRRKVCCECGRYHCSSCVQKDTTFTLGRTRRRCRKCLILLSGNFSRTDLAVFKIKDLQLFLNHKNVNTHNCKEKQDLIELTLSYCNTTEYRREQEQHRRHLQALQERKRLDQQDEQSDTFVPATPSMSKATYSHSDPTGGSPTQSREPISEESTNQMPASSAASADSKPTTSQTERPPDTPEARPQRANRARLQDIPDLESIQHMSVRQLREVLSTNYVDYKGCVEKWELVERVQRLWQQKVVNVVYAEELEKTESAGIGISGTDGNDICKICMDAIIDCVLLECGHMVTCTHCGKQLTECPICRQYVIRVVHTFKA